MRIKNLQIIRPIEDLTICRLSPVRTEVLATKLGKAVGSTDSPHPKSQILLQ